MPEAGVAIQVIITVHVVVIHLILRLHGKL
jgi:hypothetical protein